MHEDDAARVVALDALRAKRKEHAKDLRQLAKLQRKIRRNELMIRNYELVVLRITERREFRVQR